MKRMCVMILIFVSVFGWFGCSDHLANPVINDFEADSDLDRLNWKCHTLFALSPDHVTHGRGCLKLSLYPSTYPGVSFRLDHRNWKSCKRLSMDVFNPESQGELAMTVRIDDKDNSPEYQDRVNQRIILNPGMNRISLPFDSLRTPSGRLLDVSHIYVFTMFMVKPGKETVLFVDHVRLEKDET